MGSSIKPEGWESRLNEKIQSLVSTPFKWGSHDCSIFALSCIDAQYKTDIVKEIKGKYRTEKGAYKLLESYGGYQQFLTDHGFQKVPLNEAKRGDIAFLGGLTAWSVVVGDSVIATGEKGLVSFPMSKVIQVWRY